VDNLEKFKVKKYKVILLIPQEKVFEASDLQAAHNHVTVMMGRTEEGNEPAPKVHSIEEVIDQDEIDFGPSPAIPD
jgi:hypothetical protein